MSTVLEDVEVVVAVVGVGTDQGDTGDEVDNSVEGKAGESRDDVEDSREAAAVLLEEEDNAGLVVEQSVEPVAEHMIELEGQ